MQKKSFLLLIILSLSLSTTIHHTQASVGKSVLAVLTTAGGAIVGYKWGKTDEQKLSTVDIILNANAQPDFFKKLEQTSNEPQGRFAVGSMVAISSIFGYFLGAPIGLGLGAGLIGGYIEGRLLEESQPLGNKIEKKVNTWAEKLEQGLKDLENEFKKNS